MIRETLPPAPGLSAQEIAEELGVTERTVRRWVAAGLLHASRRGRTFQISLEEARALHDGSNAGRSSRRRAAVGELAEELAELRGRYLEARDRIAELELGLTTERRRAAQLEVLLEQQQAAA
jgi:excisionase family DNA binding protein